MGYTALPQHPDFVIAHAAEKVCGSLESPAKAKLGIQEATCDVDGAAPIHRKVRVQHRDFFNVVPCDEIGDLPHYPICRERIESAFVEDHVRAVVAGIRTTDAGCVGQLSNAAGTLVRVEVD